MPETYPDSDRERLVVEPSKRHNRSDFARDRARVLHSSALRRLAAKTQVVVAGESDFPRTRLTHTLEVAQIARELGEALGADADLCDLAGLAHDLGHPPFGHTGEDALDQACVTIGGFEGNAQSLRILTRLETKVRDDSGRSAGLNLTRASLDAVIKYPWPRQSGSRKFNVYADDQDLFDWVRVGTTPGRRCFEAQVMDWSDDVAYSVHDVEDGVHAGHIDLRALSAIPEQAAVCELARAVYAPQFELNELEDALFRIIDSQVWLRDFDGSFDAMVRLKNLTSALIGRFVMASLDATREAFGDGELTRYAADLLVPDEQRSEVAVLKALANLFVFQRANADQIHADQRAVLRELVVAVAERAPEVLDPLFAAMWSAADDDAARLRVVVDQIASLTDRSVLAWLDHLCR
ncbi:MAG: deoxyguanosinetriphosphate triphosphohydrolase [Actinomycetes bacterium]